MGLGKATKATYESRATRTVLGAWLVFGLSCLFCPFGLLADVVHVYERASTGELLADTTLETGRNYLTQKAPAKSGYIFTHWSISTSQAFEPRDAWGRAYDAAPYKLYEETTLTANYVPASLDSDGDGVADGYEYYWYGDLSKDANSDTDGDGYTFAQEIQLGFNPLFPERHEDGPIVFVDGAQWLYYPYGYAPYTIRSEPEGALFATVSAYVRPGTVITSYVGNPNSTAFAYWTFNGVRQADAWGRAVDSFSILMPSNAVELVAVANTTVNDKWKLYWYGTLDVAMDSDTDGDGKTFAEELAAGTNPLMPERHEDGPVTYVDGAEWLYNPNNIQPYTIMSDPEGALFATTSYYVRAGSLVNSYTKSPNNSNFAYWTFNGVVQRDAWGRAIDTVDFRMPTNAVTLVAKTAADYNERMSLYWYGNTTTAMDSDADGDGKTFAEELAAGTNPLMPERHEDGPVTYVDTSLQEINLQVYEQVEGALINGEYVRFSGFGTNINPIVQDLNGDGIFDMVIVADGATNVYFNIGSGGNPEFALQVGFDLSQIDFAGNSLNILNGLTLDVEPVGAISATTNGNVLLVSDTDGRIWYYLSSTSTPNFNYILQHKVWGGTFNGFASGLKLAAVDWEDDGDLDCLCGTADGKLMLLRNPKVGRPTNVQLFAGVDNVLLTWDPNEQSRIRGYKVYRNDSKVGDPVIPTYRDANLAAGDYGYEISSVSRFYRAGNSTPDISESMRTAAVTASVGQVTFFWNDAKVKLGDEASVMLSIENSLNYNAAGKSQTITFDPQYLTFNRVEKSGITEGLELSTTCAGGQLTVNVLSGTVAAGSGKFLTFVFDTVKAGETMVGDANVEIVDDVVVPFLMGDLDGDGDVDKDDQKLLAQFMQSAKIKYEPWQLRAGDFNGNGKLDNDDFQALKALLKSNK